MVFYEKDGDENSSKPVLRFSRAAIERNTLICHFCDHVILCYTNDAIKICYRVQIRFYFDFSEGHWLVLTKSKA